VLTHGPGLSGQFPVAMSIVVLINLSQLFIGAFEHENSLFLMYTGLVDLVRGEGFEPPCLSDLIYSQALSPLSQPRTWSTGPASKRLTRGLQSRRSSTLRSGAKFALL